MYTTFNFLTNANGHTGHHGQDVHHGCHGCHDHDHHGSHGHHCHHNPYQKKNLLSSFDGAPKTDLPQDSFLKIIH